MGQGVARKMSRTLPTIPFLVILLAFAVPTVSSDHSATTPVVDPYLLQILPTASPTETFLTVISFWHPGDRSTLDGFVTHYKFETLPMAAAYLTPGQLSTLSTWTQIQSIWFGLHELPLKLSEGRELVQASQATALFGVTGKGVKVAVIDTGVDTLHPDFGGRATNFEVAFAGVCVFPTVPNSDDIGHGTHVSGTIAGSGALSDGKYKGVAPEAQIVSYDTNAALAIITIEALCSYDNIIARGDIKVISNSWGGGEGSWDRDNPIEIAIRNAYAKGIASVFAAGNSGPGDNTMTRQSVSPYSIGVAAITKKKQVVGFSSRGRPLGWTPPDHWPLTHDRDEALAKNIPLFRPGVSAPGVSITAPVPCSPVCNSATGYDTMSGTSMATPHVSGVLALALQKNPNLTPRQMAGILEAGPTALPDWLAHETGAGLANALKAVELASKLAANPSTTIPKPTLDESLNGKTTTRSNFGPVPVFGSNPGGADPNNCPICVDVTVNVPTGATRLYVKIEWTNDANNFYGYAFSPGQSTSDFPTQEDTGLLDIPLNERFLDVRTPVSGQWLIRILPRANTFDTVEAVIFTSTA